MKRLVIQLNFISGLGDFFCAMSESANYALRAKRRGYSVELLVSLHSGQGPRNRYVRDIKIWEIFNRKWLESIFCKITHQQNSYILKELEGLVYHPRLGHHTPGTIGWDIYKSNLFEGEDSFLNTSTYISASEYSFNRAPWNELPETIPVFVDDVYIKSKMFLNNKPTFDFLHLRYYDGSIDSSVYDYYRELYEIVEDISFKSLENSSLNLMIGGNESKWIKKLCLLKNVFSYPHRHTDEFINNHSYYEFSGGTALMEINKYSVSEDKLYQRLIDNYAEMVSIAQARNFFIFSVYPWVSQFLLYAFLNKKQNKIPYTVNIINLDSELICKKDKKEFLEYRFNVLSSNNPIKGLRWEVTNY